MLARNGHKEGWVFFEKYLGLGGRTFTVVALGAIIMAIVCVLSGCGSDSSSPQTNAKKSIVVKKMPGLKDPGKSANVPTGEINLLISDSLSGLKDEEQRAKKEAAAKAALAKAMSDPNFEVLPGMTVAKIKAKEQEALRKLSDPNFKVAPGVTMAEMKAKEQEALRKLSDPNFEVAPGVTMAEMKANEAEILRKAERPQF